MLIWVIKQEISKVYKITKIKTIWFCKNTSYIYVFHINTLWLDDWRYIKMNNLNWYIPFGDNSLSLKAAEEDTEEVKQE